MLIIAYEDWVNATVIAVPTNGAEQGVAKIVAKKARAQSIYDFIEWRHLLTSGNKASFSEYKRFIERFEYIESKFKENLTKASLGNIKKAWNEAKLDLKKNAK